MPSLTSSPRICSVPQSEFSLAIVAISSRTSGLNRGRPSCRRERQRQSSRQPRRCQRRTVSGHQNEMAPPARVDAPGRQPEEPIAGLEAGSRTRTQGDLELVAQK